MEATVNYFLNFILKIINSAKIVLKLIKKEEEEVIVASPSRLTAVDSHAKV